MKFRITFILCLLTWGLSAQAPVINSITPLSSAPLQYVIVTGSGFSTDPTKLIVWFDHVRGTVVSSTAFSIEVQVPAQARFSNIEVVNLTNNLSAKSPLKFLPSYGGEQFSQAKVSTPFTNIDLTELFDIASSDLDLDGKPDLIATKTNNGATATDLIIYKNQSLAIGTISFAKFDKTNLAALDLGAPTANVTCGDLNGDGKPDIVATRNGATRNEVLILKNTNSVAGTLSFAAVQKVLLDVGQFAFRVSIRDLNGDGKSELIVSNAFDDGSPTTDNQIYVFPNQSTVSTISFGTPLKLSVVTANTTYGLDVQDLDGDGLADIVVNQFNTNNIFVFKNQSTGSISFAASQKITITAAFNSVIATDINKDGLMDLAVTATLDNNLQILINNSSSGNISFQPPQILTTSLGPWGVDASDMDGDGDVDLIVANRNEAKVNVFRQDAALVFTKLDIPTAKPCRNLRVGDYDADGKPDIAVTSFSSAFSVDVIRNANCVSPKITNPTPGTICTAQTIRLQAVPALGVTFDWKLNGTTFSSSAGTVDFKDVTSAGTYTILATGELGACAVTSPSVVLNSGTGSAPANPPINFNTPCIGNALNLSTTAVASATYTWTGPNNFTSGAQNPTIPIVTTNTGGIYQLQVTVGGCSSNLIKQQIDVASVPVLPVSASPGATACAGSTVTLSVTGSGYTFQWLKGGIAVGGETAASIAATQEGDYSLVVTSIATSCSQETAKTSVKLLSVPVSNFSFPTSTCKDAVITFTNSSTVDSRATVVYAWDFGNASTSSQQNPTATYATAGPFNPKLTVSYSGVVGCSNFVTKPITIFTPTIPTISATFDPICPGEPSVLSITGAYNTIVWVGVSGSTNSVSITQSGSYSVNTTDANGCVSSAAKTIQSKPVISPFKATADKPTITLGQSVQLTATLGADIYAWSPPDGLNSVSINNPIATPTATITYVVVAKQSGKCDAQASLSITVLPPGDIALNPPKLFSPNGDGNNDKWVIPNATNSDCTMTIYDGHGSQVFEKKGYSNDPWDGMLNGNKVPDGVYFYVFSCPDKAPSTGSVLVVK